MRAYIDQLRKLSEAANEAEQALQTNQPPLNEYLPLSQQISQLLVSLPESQRNREWRIVDLVEKLSGKYREKPHPMKVADQLRRLGWTQRRDYTREGRGARVWVPPLHDG